ALWVICPLSLRYSLEGRPYMQAMFFAMLAVLSQVELCKTNKLVWAFLLAVCLGAAVYSQPYSLFGPLGYAVCSTWQRRDSKYFALTYSAYALAALPFVPWLVLVKDRWVHAIDSNHWRFDWHLF